MGLGVAYELIKKGYKPILYEADDRIGGMTANFDFNGVDIERFYHFHCKTDQHFFNLLEDLGLVDKFHWKNTKMGFWYKNKIHSWSGPFDLLTFPYLNFYQKIRYGLNTLFATRVKKWEKLDKISAEQWLIKSLGEKTFNILWKKLFALKFYQYADKISAAWIWSRIKRTGLSRKSIFTEQLGYLDGGSTTLLKALENYILIHGGEIHLNSAVKQVQLKKNKVHSIVFADKTIPAKIVISTIPVPYINKIIPDLPQVISQKFKKLKNIGVVCVVVKLKQSISKYFWLNINDDEMDIPGIIEYTNLRKINEQIIAYIPFYMPQDNNKFKDSDETYISKVMKYIQKINPNVKKTDFLDFKVNRYFFSQPICEIEHLKKLPNVNLPIHGLYVADTSYYYPEDRGISESIGFAKKISDFFIDLK